MNKLLQIIQTIPKLGYKNVAYMAWYRYSLKSGLRKWLFPVGESVEGPFFKLCKQEHNYPKVWMPALRKRADEIVDGKLHWFWFHQVDAGSPPKWFNNPFDDSDLSTETQRKHWTELGDFDLNTGDIKILWEPSRFYWLTNLARAYRVYGKKEYLTTINEWLEDWSANNPLNVGPNWKCGQETSIRIFNLVQAAQILDQHKECESALCTIIEQHVKRVAANLRYAVAQDNNHGTSEAAGLIIGGAFLQSNSQNSSVKKQAQKWIKKGRDLLEERINYLISEDGSFSQHSINYHRMLIDTLSLVEVCRREYNLEAFSDEFYATFKAAVDWVEQMMDTSTGQSLNLGHNDGSRLLNTHSCSYIDYRPTVQTARVLLNESLRFDDGIWNESLFWFDADITKMNVEPIKKKTAILDDRYLILNEKNAWGMLRLPGFDFRPAQNDLFHFDLWVDGVNIACDAGSYSYADPAGEEFTSVKSHNTVQFGNTEPMPKIGKFLHTHWVQSIQEQVFRTKGDVKFWEGKVRDFRGNQHHREISVTDNTWKIRDHVVSDGEKVVVRWHLPVKMEKVELKKNRIELENCVISFNSDAKVSLEKAERSLYYFQKEECTCVVVEFGSKELVTTTFKT
ncbi:MAG: heparinase II/III family protein [Balneolaceae bacterium]